MRIVAVVQNRASVLKVGLEQSRVVRRLVSSVVADRVCPALDTAREHGIPVSLIDEPDNLAFSDRLADHCDRVGADGIFLFFGRILRGDLLQRYRNRIVNIHPSLLPSFKGLHGFDDTYGSGVRFAGSTIHFIDENVDEGRVIVQTVTPLDWSAGEQAQRQRQFEQMCRAFVQVCEWWSENRIVIDGPGTVVTGARFDDPEFSPALESSEALGLRFGTDP